MCMLSNTSIGQLNITDVINSVVNKNIRKTLNIKTSKFGRPAWTKLLHCSMLECRLYGRNTFTNFHYVVSTIYG